MVSTQVWLSPAETALTAQGPASAPSRRTSRGPASGAPSTLASPGPSPLAAPSGFAGPPSGGTALVPEDEHAVERASSRTAHLRIGAIMSQGGTQVPGSGTGRPEPDGVEADLAAGGVQPQADDLVAGG